MKKVLIIAVLVIILIFLLYYLSNLKQNNNQANLNQNQNEILENTNENAIVKAEFSDALNTTYLVNGQTIKLVNGYYETIEPESKAKLIVRVFGEPNMGDINYDEIADAAIMLSYDSGGSGIFYYVAGAINNNGLYYGTNAILLGDRIAPQNIKIENKIIIANYADRLPGEPMTTEPSVGVSRYLKHENDELFDANRKDDLIIVDMPIANSQISSPLTFSGRARGNWFFEASFPVSLVNWDGLIIAEGIATAQGDWMTEDYVPFSGTLTFDKPSYGDRGAIIFQKDNPSGLSQYDNALEISIRY